MIEPSESGIEARWALEREILEAAHVAKLEVHTAASSTLSHDDRERLTARLLHRFATDAAPYEHYLRASLIREGLDSPATSLYQPPTKQPLRGWMVNLVIKFVLAAAAFEVLGFVQPGQEGLCALELLVWTLLGSGMMATVNRIVGPRRARVQRETVALQPQVKALSQQEWLSNRARNDAVLEMYRRHGVRRPLEGLYLAVLPFPVAWGLRLGLIVWLGGLPGGFELHSWRTVVAIFGLSEAPFVLWTIALKTIGTLRVRAGLRERDHS